MGVQNLWQLLLPVGRRINIESLSQKTLAIDVSIWLVQFIKAMRDEEGKMIQNAHIIGCFRRIAKLIFHHIKPVFVFDGGVPLLKRKTVEVRRQRRHEKGLSLRQQAQSILVTQIQRQMIQNKALEEAGKLNKDVGSKGYAPGFDPGAQVSHASSAASAVSTSALEEPPKQNSNTSILETTVGIQDGGGEDEEWEDGNMSDQASQAGSDSDIDIGIDAAQNENIDESSLRAMPVGMRKNIIEAVHRDYRKLSRDSYITVAGDMDAYSSTQVVNFLRVSKFNQKVWNITKSEQEENNETGVFGIASEKNRSFFLGKASSSFHQKRKYGASNAKNTDMSKSKTGTVAAMKEWLEANNVSSEEEEIEGSLDSGNKRQRKSNKLLLSSDQSVKSTVADIEAKTRKARKAACLDSDDSNDEQSETEGGGFIMAKDINDKQSETEGGGFIMAKDINDKQSETEGGGFIMSEDNNDKQSETEGGGFIMAEDNNEKQSETEGGGFIMSEDTEVAKEEQLNGDGKHTTTDKVSSSSSLSSPSETSAKREASSTTSPKTTTLKKHKDASLYEQFRNSVFNPYISLSRSCGDFDQVLKLWSLQTSGNKSKHVLKVLHHQLTQCNKFKGTCSELKHELLHWMNANRDMVIEDVNLSSLSSSSSSSLVHICRLKDFVDLHIDYNSYDENKINFKFDEFLSLYQLDDSQVPTRISNDSCTLISAVVMFGLRIHLFVENSEVNPLTLASPFLHNQLKAEDIYIGIKSDFYIPVKQAFEGEIVENKLGNNGKERRNLIHSSSLKKPQQIVIDDDNDDSDSEIEIDMTSKSSTSKSNIFDSISKPSLNMFSLMHSETEKKDENIEWESGLEKSDLSSDDTNFKKSDSINAEALSAAISTADGLASWASRVVRRAIVKHNETSNVDRQSIPRSQLPNATKVSFGRSDIESSDGKYDVRSNVGMDQSEEVTLKANKAAADNLQLSSFSSEPPLLHSKSSDQRSQATQASEEDEKGMGRGEVEEEWEEGVAVDNDEFISKHEEAIHMSESNANLDPNSGSNSKNDPEFANNVKKVSFNITQDQHVAQHEEMFNDQAPDIALDSANTSTETIKVVPPLDKFNPNTEAGLESTMATSTTLKTSDILNDKSLKVSMPLSDNDSFISTPIDVPGESVVLLNGGDNEEDGDYDEDELINMQISEEFSDILPTKPPLSSSASSSFSSSSSSSLTAAQPPSFESQLNQPEVDIGKLKQKKNQLSRDSEHVTDQMVEDVKELLDLFGIPYITAPMEAEAQCAFLEQEGLVDGVVTDDSDVFLFGAKTVYKNIFDHNRYVEAYLATDVEKELGLSREDLISLAMLLGSDYTIGIKGVGIVNAMEILGAFSKSNDEEDSNANSKPESSFQQSEDKVIHPLTKFKEWHADFDILKEAASKGKRPKKTSSKKKKSKAKRKKTSVVDTDESDEDDDDGERDIDVEKLDESPNKALSNFDEKHRSARSRWMLGSNFPDPAVAKAYLKPTVSKPTSSSQNTSKFSWKSVDKEGIYHYAYVNLGWNKEEVNKIIGPAFEKLEAQKNNGGNQTRLDSYYLAYHDNTKFARIRSTRLEKSVRKLTGKEISTEGTSITQKTTQRKPKVSKSNKIKNKKQASTSNEDKEGGKSFDDFLAEGDVTIAQCDTSSQEDLMSHSDSVMTGDKNIGSSGKKTPSRGTKRQTKRKTKNKGSDDDDEDFVL